MSTYAKYNIKNLIFILCVKHYLIYNRTSYRISFRPNIAKRLIKMIDEDDDDEDDE